LIIATLDDGGDLGRCLERLAGFAKDPPFEVIVVDQNDDEQLAPVLAAFAGRLELVHRRVAFRGASRARNVGAAAARGHWLGFPDDDCQLLPDTLAQVERLAADPCVRVITGRTIDGEGNANLLRWREERLRFTRWTMFGCLTEATLFVRRELFLAAGGFDERFGPGAPYPAAEGIELMNRLFGRLGDGEACYSPSVQVTHPTKVPPWNRWAVSRFHTYAIGDGALIAKSPQPHLLLWGLRMVLAATLQMLSLRGWRSAAYAARLLGLVRGFCSFRLAAWRG
jgi:glycosyltransferase involved in cell wall biosynthesis